MLLRQKIIAAVAGAFLLVAFFSHLRAAPVPGHGRLRQVRRRAAVVVAVVAAVEPERLAFFLVGRALHLHALHRLRRLVARAVGHMRPVLFAFRRALHLEVRQPAEA